MFSKIRLPLVPAMFFLIFSVLPGCRTLQEPFNPAIDAQKLTPVIGYVNESPKPARASDGKYYITYELVIANITKSDIAIDSIKIHDNSRNELTVLTMNRAEIARNMNLARKDAVLKAFESGFIRINLEFSDLSSVPGSVDHLLSLKMDKPYQLFSSVMDERIARTEFDKSEQLVIGPPLRGGPWLAVNVGKYHDHRLATMPIDGRWISPERWAIDWVMLTDDNRIFKGDNAKNESYPQFGKELIAVMDGKIIKAVDVFDDIMPGKLPDNMTLDNAAGNYVMIDIGDGYSALYAHIKKGTVKVKEGDTVRKGQVIGLLGNSGNTDAPHLHFHVLRGKTPLGNQGEPYVIDSFEILGVAKDAGKVDEALATGDRIEISVEKEEIRSNNFPEDVSIIKFPN